jgi:hypothetical protein
MIYGYHLNIINVVLLSTMSQPLCVNYVKMNHKIVILVGDRQSLRQRQRSTTPSFQFVSYKAMRTTETHDIIGPIHYSHIPKL